MITPGAGAAATSPHAGPTYTAHPRPNIDSNSAAARTDTMTGEPTQLPWWRFARPARPTRLPCPGGVLSSPQRVQLTRAGDWLSENARLRVRPPAPNSISLRRAIAGQAPPSCELRRAQNSRICIPPSTMSGGVGLRHNGGSGRGPLDKPASATGARPIGPGEAVDRNRSLRRQIDQIWAATGQRTPHRVGVQIGGAVRSNQVQCRSPTVIGLCSAEQYPGAWVGCWQAGWASADPLEMRRGAAPAPGCGLPAISLGL